MSELEDRGGDAPAPAHEGPEERELPAALRGGRAAERLRGQAALRAPAAGRAAAARPRVAQAARCQMQESATGRGAFRRLSYNERSYSKRSKVIAQSETTLQ